MEPLLYTGCARVFMCASSDVDALWLNASTYRVGFGCEGYCEERLLCSVY